MTLLDVLLRHEAPLDQVRRLLSKFDRFKGKVPSLYCMLDAPIRLRLEQSLAQPVNATSRMTASRTVEDSSPEDSGRIQVIVDASNVVRFHAEKPDVEHLLSIASQLEELGCTPVLVADSNLFSRLANHPTQQRLYDALCRDGRISVAAHETSADLEIMRFAGQRHAAGRRVLVLSRDRFNWDRQRERWEKRIGAIAFAELLATRDRLRKDNLFYAFSVVGGSARLSQEFEHRVRELQRQTKAS